MSDNYIRICPVCERENTADASRCGCGTSLMGVDFSMKVPPTEPATPLAARPLESVSSKEDGHIVSTALNAEVAIVMCAHPDCAQPNPQGVVRCLYCNRPLGGVSEENQSDAVELQMRLPPLLRSRFTVIELLPTVGAEADLLRVGVLADGTERVIKLYRQGMEGDPALLEKLMQVRDPHVIQVDEADISNGVRFEVMEYFPLGNLRQLLDTGPTSVDRIREIVSEIGQALAQVQAQNILHRDLKPENVLVRALSPLSLVLTDFGIASVRMATQHFTGGARTTRYAAPEALTGVIDERADWWSLGMIILEAAVGRHPFEGLNEQIINHQLATKPIDVRTVFHDDLRKLCRGLLLRDPRVRWSWPEVQRWLASDPTLLEPQEGPLNAALRAYRIADSQCTTAVELAVTLVKHWDLGAKDLARGTVSHWLEEQLHDHNLLRKLQDIKDVRGVSDDWRLLKFVLLAVPDIPAVWKGVPVSRESLLIAARKATSGDRRSAAWLHSLHVEGVLEALAQGQRPEVAVFRQRWLQGLEQFSRLWALAREAEDRWQREPKAWYGSSQVVVDVDYAMYLQSARMQQPAFEDLHGHVLLAVSLPAYVAMVRTNIVHAIASSGDFCPWLNVLGPIHELDSIGVIAAQLLLPLAQEDMAKEAAHVTSAQHHSISSADEGTFLLLQEAQTVLDLVKAGLGTPGARLQLRDALEALQTAGFRFIRLAPTETNAAKVRSSMDSLLSASIGLQSQLDEMQAIERVNTILYEPRRLLVGGSILLGLWSLLPGGYAALLLAGAVAGGVWRYRLLREAKSSLDKRTNAFVRLCERTMGRRSKNGALSAPH